MPAYSVAHESSNPNFITAVKHNPAMDHLQLPAMAISFFWQLHEEVVLSFARDFFVLPNSLKQVV